MNYSPASLLARYGKILRFLISGGSAAVTNLGVLYIATHILGVWYIASSVIAFVLSFFVSFTMQKFWTFGNSSMHLLQGQMIKYFIFMIINLGVNTLMMYFFVEYSGLHYMAAQILTMALLAFVSFFVYQFVIFKSTVSIPLAQKALS